MPPISGPMPLISEDGVGETDADADDGDAREDGPCPGTVSCMKWQRGPYGQRPVLWNVRHISVLYFGWRCIWRNSPWPCANWGWHEE